MKKSLFILMLILLSNVCWAQDHFISFYGMGEVSCGKYVKQVKESLELKNLYSWWIGGFVTGTNMAKQRRTSTDNEAHEAWLFKYCQDNPLDSFLTAVWKLDKMLDAK